MSEPVTDYVDQLAGMAAIWEQIEDGRPPAQEVEAATWVEVIEAMADVRRSLVATGGWRTGPSTLMGVLELSRDEVRNCRVLRWLLDPMAHHGFGERLVADLTGHLGVAWSDPALTVVAVEVSREESRADVVLQQLAGSGVIVIEAKTDAAEGERQARRLESDWPGADCLVFLTVVGSRVPSTAADPSRWRPLSWSWIANRLEAILEVSEPATDPRTIDARRAAADWAANARRDLT